jgi:hypothetical protein
MRTRHLRRITSASLAAVFLFALAADSLARHPCPHHLGMGAAADHGSGHESDDASNHGSHGPCTCVGRCHAGTAPPLPVPILLGAVPVPETAPATPLDPAAPDRCARTPFSLPWANAPPRL